MPANLRILGYNIKTLIEEQRVSEQHLKNLLGLSENDLQRVYVGRLLLSPTQLNKVLNILKVPFERLTIPPQTIYGKAFPDGSLSLKGEDLILNIIDDYIDLVEAGNKLIMIYAPVAQMVEQFTSNE